ncbi:CYTOMEGALOVIRUS UL139 PROTEIN [Salix koriyanagi]|uniref:CYTOMEGALOVIRUS UL139 PROTEIN n=1 Tax=Salix koriyanagi TaxID=2511006 RepID=A0A9Q0UYM9_9ROSI|nr:CYTOMEGALOVIRUS UL139 PROTEIN [Salix koriyanagi]KAJ6738864.1 CYTOMEGALOVIRUS UL139 PROTEIN [Salix koriyanagi]
MALSSSFQERLEQMESTRNQRLSLLQAEKELQTSKSQMLASKLVNIRSMEQRCLVLVHKIAFQDFKILALKSEIESLDAKYDAYSQIFRVLKSEVEEMEEMEKEKERFYQVKGLDMKAFSENVDKFVKESRIQVKELRNRMNGLNSIFIKLQENNGLLSNSEIAEVEMIKSQLLL